MFGDHCPVNSLTQLAESKVEWIASETMFGDRDAIDGNTINLCHAAGERCSHHLTHPLHLPSRRNPFPQPIPRRPSGCRQPGAGDAEGGQEAGYLQVKKTEPSVQDVEYLKGMRTLVEA